MNLVADTMTTAPPPVVETVTIVRTETSGGQDDSVPTIIDVIDDNDDDNYDDNDDDEKSSNKNYDKNSNQSDENHLPDDVWNAMS